MSEKYYVVLSRTPVKDIEEYESYDEMKEGLKLIIKSEDCPYVQIFKGKRLYTTKGPNVCITEDKQNFDQVDPSANIHTIDYSGDIYC